MYASKKALPRRTFLRGVGATVALPLLDAMVPSFTALAQTPAVPRTRFGAVFIPNGAIMESWTPVNGGTGLTLSPSLKPLEPFRDRLVVVSNLVRAATPGGDHAVSAAGWLDFDVALALEVAGASTVLTSLPCALACAMHFSSVAAHSTLSRASSMALSVLRSRRCSAFCLSFFPKSPSCACAGICAPTSANKRKTGTSRRVRAMRNLQQLFGARRRLGGANETIGDCCGAMDFFHTSTNPHKSERRAEFTPRRSASAGMATRVLRSVHLRSTCDSTDRRDTPQLRARHPGPPASD